MDKVKNGLFFNKSLYKALELRTPSSFPWKCIWKTCVQPKISFFTWEATWGKILTCDQLQKRGLSLASCCPLRLESEELVDHLLLHCSKTRALGFAFVPLWSLLDFGYHSQGLPLRMEGYFSSQREVRGLECGPFVHFLDSLEDHKWHCF